MQCVIKHSKGGLIWISLLSHTLLETHWARSNHVHNQYKTIVFSLPHAINPSHRNGHEQQWLRFIFHFAYSLGVVRFVIRSSTQLTTEHFMSSWCIVIFKIIFMGHFPFYLYFTSEYNRKFRRNRARACIICISCLLYCPLEYNLRRVWPFFLYNKNQTPIWKCSVIITNSAM